MNDEELNVLYWEEIRKGNKQSLFDLYNNTYFHLVRYGLKITGNDEIVKDCVMELFLKLWSKHAQLNTVVNVKSYLFTSLKRMLFDQQNYNDKTDTAINNLYDKDDLSELSYEEIIISVQENDHLKMKLFKAMKQLTPKQTELIRLKFFEGLSYEQVALESSQNIKTTYNTIYNAIKILRKLLT